MKIFVEYYQNNYRQLNALIDEIRTNSEAIRKMYELCVLNLRVQEDISSLNTQDKNILSLFLGEYRDANGNVPEEVQRYNSGVLTALQLNVPKGSLDHHQLRKLNNAEAVYRCFMEQCAVDGTIDTQEWCDKIYEDIKDFNLGDNARSEIKAAVKHEADIAGVEHFMVKYTKGKEQITDTDFIIDKVGEEQRNKARKFYQNRILIVFTYYYEEIAEYFLGILNENREKIDPTLPAPRKMEMKEYRKREGEIEASGNHIIMVGDSFEAKKFYKHAKNGIWDYYHLGMRFVSQGTKTVLLARKLKDKQIDDLVKLGKELGEKHNIKIPEGVASLDDENFFDVYRDLFEDVEDVSDGIIAGVGGILVTPIVVAGQALVGAANAIQGTQNLAASKKLEFLQYSIAIYEYLDREKVIVD
jgi:hypothetical protein